MVSQVVRIQVFVGGCHHYHHDFDLLKKMRLASALSLYRLGGKSAYENGGRMIVEMALRLLFVLYSMVGFIVE